MILYPIDHLVYAVTDLDAAIADFEKRAGIRPVFGGYHITKGTKNALVHLGKQCYLELLAIDENNTTIQAPRWMGVDLIQENQITRWALQSTDLQQDSEILKTYNPRLSEISSGERQTTSGDLLAWQMTLPLPSPAVDLLPFFLNWESSAVHPTDNLVQACELLQIKMTHPNPSAIQNIFAKLTINIDLVQAAQASIKATIQTPNGLIEI